MSSSWAPDPKNHAYVWTFTKRSLMMRYFLWLYEADQTAMTFCRFFWGMVCSPIALPIRLAKGLLRLTWDVSKLICRGIAATVRWTRTRPMIKLIRMKAGELLSNLSTSRRVYLQRKEAIRWAEKEAIIAARHRRSEEERLAEWYCDTYRLTYQGPPPSVQTKIANSAGERVDRIVAWFQAHPQIIARTSKVITRGIFYPLAFLIPTSAVAFMGFEAYEHSSGWLGAMHYAWSDTFSGLALAFKGLGAALWMALRVAGPMVGLAIGYGVGLSILMLGSLWIMVKLDGRHDRRWDAMMAGRTYGIDAREAPDSVFFLKARASLDKRLGRAAHALSPAAHVTSRGFALFGRGIAKGASRVASGVSTAASVAGRGTVAMAGGTAQSVHRTRSFFAVAHHAIKYRTCPRIEITE